MTTWIKDDNGNRCSVEFWGSKEAAQAALDSLKDCSRCMLHRQSQIERSIAILSQDYATRRRSHRATRNIVRQLVEARAAQMRMEKIHASS